MSHTHTVCPSVMDACSITNGHSIHRCHHKVKEEEHQCLPHVVSHTVSHRNTVFYTEGTSVFHDHALPWGYSQSHTGSTREHRHAATVSPSRTHIVLPHFLPLSPWEGRGALCEPQIRLAAVRKEA